MTLKFDPDGTFKDHVDALLLGVKDVEVRAVLRSHINSISSLAAANTAPARDNLLTELQDLITDRIRKAAGE